LPKCGKPNFSHLDLAGYALLTEKSIGFGIHLALKVVGIANQCSQKTTKVFSTEKESSMKTNSKRATIAGLVAVAVIALGTNVFAGRGMGHRYDGAGGGPQQSRYGWACDRMANLTPEQQEQMDAQRQSFLEATQDERQEILAKRLELKAEIAKSEPDPLKASTLQKELSELRGNLDQQRLEHIMAMRRVHPEAGRGFFRERPGMGRGMGHGRGIGYGPGCLRQ
jgi:zinc resistance-associated protein